MIFACKGTQNIPHIQHFALKTFPRRAIFKTQASLNAKKFDSEIKFSIYITLLLRFFL